jgi:hypothetical protein
MLRHITDDFEARNILGCLIAAVKSGSYPAIARSTLEVTGAKMAAAIDYWNAHGTRPEATPFGDPEAIDQFCAVARKP